MLKHRDFKGSRLRCLLATNQRRERVAEFLTALAAPHAVVGTDDVWFPSGFLSPAEVDLANDANGVVPNDIQKVLQEWWLVQRARTANWDVVSSAQFGDKKGVLLVEAKAHEDEVCDDTCGAKQPNLARIEAALAEANEAWNKLHHGISLSAKSLFQVSNRLAFAWKLAQLRMPVVLVYLGLLDANEMAESGKTVFHDHAQWYRCLTTRAKVAVPPDAWNRTYEVGDHQTLLAVAIKSATVSIDTRVREG